MEMLESLFKAACRIDNNMPRSVDLSDNIVDEQATTEDSPDASSSAEFTDSKADDSAVPKIKYTELEKQYDQLYQYCLRLENKHNKYNEFLDKTRLAQDCAQEKLRRQTEILQGCQADLRTALEENTGLVFQLSNLKKWTDSLNDDEAADMMRHVYMDLETWVKYHFNRNSPGKTRLAADPINHLSLFYNVYASLANIVFETFLSNAMVGIDEPSLNKNIQIIDDEVQKQCPEHVRQHWRSATSTALSSLGEQGLSARYERSIETLEAEYAQYSSTDPEKRRYQLKALLQKFVQLKMRLERQVDQYFFERILPDTPFCGDRMTSLTGGFSGQEIVEYNLSPILFKISSGCELTLVEKASVKTRFVSNPPPADNIPANHTPGEDLDCHNSHDIWSNHQLFK